MKLTPNKIYILQLYNVQISVRYKFHLLSYYQFIVSLHFRPSAQRHLVRRIRY